MYQPADHIKVTRTGYEHHGIYIGDNYVIEFGASSLSDMKNAEIQKVTLEEFANGATIKKVRSLLFFPDEDVIKRAISKIGSKNYHLTQNNCEHFANWCRSGIKFSFQSDILKILPDRTGATITILNVVKNLIRK